MKAVLLLLLLFAAPVFMTPVGAAPICENKGGYPVHCDSPGALPLGAKAEPADRHFDPTDGRAVEQALAIVALLLVLIALLPRFDGAHWDKQEDDTEE